MTYVDGREHGPQLYMHKNGKIWRRGVMRDDHRYGRWLEGGDGICVHPSFPSWVITGPARVWVFSR